MSNHVAVWLDHNEAKIFHVTPDTFQKETVVPAREHRKLHRRSGPGAESGHRAHEDQHYYHDVAAALTGADEILVVGPATAKLELVKHIHKHDPQMVPKLIGVETVDHPSDRQLVAYIRTYFEALEAKREEQASA